MSLLADVLSRVDPLLRGYGVADPGPGRFEAAPSRERAYVLEAVYEGHLLHHGEPRAFAGMDEDMRLLGGDSLYALGLSRLAELGDLEAVAELAELIAMCAWAEAEGNAELVDELWRRSAERICGAR
jgi:hypothetical protein